MQEIIDLSQEIFVGMHVYKSLSPVKITVHSTHEEWEGIKESEVSTPSVLKIEMGEHTGTHVDALSHMSKKQRKFHRYYAVIHVLYSRCVSRLFKERV